MSILPEVGAKILTLFDKESGREFLWQNPRIRPQRYPVDANFDNYWCGGWDDAFPTADACIHKGEQYPNLGELRSLEWTVQDLCGGDSTTTASFVAFGPISAIKAKKTVSMEGRHVRLHFEVESLDSLPIDFLWGTHPALAVSPGTRLIIPARTGVVAQSSHPSLGSTGQRYNWPLLESEAGTIDMSIVRERTDGNAFGHYVTDLDDGWYAVETGRSGVLFEFSLQTCPCLWLWLVYGGWRGYYHAIVEPWTGYPVNLEQAVKEGRASQLLPGTTFAATVNCTTYNAPESSAEALSRLRSV